jgi:hypothetical protein
LRTKRTPRDILLARLARYDDSLADWQRIVANALRCTGGYRDGYFHEADRNIRELNRQRRQIQAQIDALDRAPQQQEA